MDDWTPTGVDGVDISGNEDVILLWKYHEPLKLHIRATALFGIVDRSFGLYTQAQFLHLPLGS